MFRNWLKIVTGASVKSKSNSGIRSRHRNGRINNGLRFEALENRQMLSGMSTLVSLLPHVAAPPVSAHVQAATPQASLSSQTALTSNINPAVADQLVVLTATVSGTSAGQATPTGMITFMDGTTTLGTANLRRGTAVLRASLLTVGSHSITATYGGDANFSSSASSPLTETIKQASTKTFVTSSEVKAPLDGPVTFTAFVADPPFGAKGATGTVQFMDGSSPLGVPQAVRANGAASITISTLGVGQHTITAVYSGDSNFAGSTSSGRTENIVVPPTGSINGTGTTFRNSETLTVTNAAATVTNGVPSYSGSISFTDTHGDSLTNTTITSVFINSSGHSAIITGTGTWDGTDGYNFTLYVANWSLGKHSLDSFGLVITGQNATGQQVHATELGLFPGGSLTITLDSSTSGTSSTSTATDAT